MEYKEIRLHVSGSKAYARLDTYILDTPKDHIKITKRPAIILCPGGGYEFTSFREGEPMAMYYLSQGYHVGVLHYSVAPAVFPTSLLELGTAVKLFHDHGEEWKVDEDAIFVQGSSAGGHLAASLGVFWNQPFMEKALKISGNMLKPKGLILSYPVISSEEAIAHKGSFRNLAGADYEAKKQYLSLEHQVGAHMPPCFIWHTDADQTVPVENSLVLAMALKKYKIPMELHIFQNGNHGLGSATEIVRRPDGSGVQEECQCWMKLSDIWMKNLKGEEKE